MKKILLTVAVVAMMLKAWSQPTITTLASFNGTNGSGASGFTLGSDGNYYGVSAGGAYGGGSLFQFITNGTNGTIIPLYSFSRDVGGSNATPSIYGTSPNSVLTMGKDGNLYGIATQGGSFNYGTIFKFNTNGILSLAATFDNTNGSWPQGEMTLGKDGNLFGTSQRGGAYNGGTIFRLDTNGTLTTLFSFDGTNSGRLTNPSLAQDRDGNLYGSTVTGGPAGFGTVFAYRTNGVLTNLLNLNSSYGYGVGKILVAYDGNLYFSYTGNGSPNFGALLRMTPNGAITTLLNYSGTNYNSDGIGNLIQGMDGNLYGTMNAIGYGSVAQLKLDGTTSKFAPFSSTNGYWPNYLIQVSDGTLYGTASGGSYGYGTIFKVSIPPPPATSVFAVNNQPLIVFPKNGLNYVLQMNTNLASTNWVTVTNGVMMNAILITNAPPAAFFRLQ